MRLQKMGNIIAIESRTGQVTGFHSGKLEVAGLSLDAWKALEEKTPGEALEQLSAWGQELANVVPREKSQKFQSITINVTQVCNLHCTYCAAGGDGTFGDPVKRISVEKTIPQLKFLLKRVEQGGHFQVTFIGGEPLLYPEGIQILADFVREESKARSITNEFIVVTNGTQFNAKTIPVLKSIKAHLTVSIDGPAEINDVNRPTKGGKGATAQVIKGLQLLLRDKTGLGNIGLSGVFGKNNLDLEKAYDFYKSFDVEWFDFTYDHLETLPEHSRAYTEQVLKMAEKALSTEGEKGLRKIKFFDSLFLRLDLQDRIENYCGAGKSYLVVDARNNLYTCPWLVGEAGEIVGTQDKLFKDKLDSYQAPLIEKNGCQDCWAKYLCGGGCMYIHRNKTGSKHQVDENFCERTRTLMAMGIVYYEQCRTGGTVESTQADGSNAKSENEVVNV